MSYNISYTNKSALYPLAIVILTFFAYSNVFHGPFVFDDIPNIAENHVIKNLNFFKDPSQAKNLEYYSMLRIRYIGYLTFALNNKIHELDPAGYHLANVIIHALNGLLIYLFVVLIFRASKLKNGFLKKHSREIALFGALLFVSHPVQTQAVTYIVQRFTSLASFFFFSALVAYSKFRLALNNREKILFYALTLFSAILAMNTKEIAVTLPVMIIILEFIFFDAPMKKRLVYLIPILLTLFIIPINTFFALDRPIGEIISNIGDFARVQTDMSRMDYLFTELRVTITYLRLFLFPVNQNLDYDYPLFYTFVDPQVFVSFFILATMLVAAVYLLSRSRRTDFELRLISFGLFFFFITMIPESYLIPVVDVIFEHRLYLPSFGLIISLCVLVFYIAEKTKMRVLYVYILLSLLVLSLSAATFKRNLIWADDVNLWQDTAMKSAKKARPFNSLGVAYKNKKQLNEAIRAFQTAIENDPLNADAYTNLGVVYWELGRKEEAISEMLRALTIKPSAEIYLNIGIAYMKMHKPAEAIPYLRSSIISNSGFSDAYKALGQTYLALKRTDEAINILREGVYMIPNNPDLYYNLGTAYLMHGDKDAAYKTYLGLQKIDETAARCLLAKFQ